MAKYTLTESREAKALEYINKRRAEEFSGKLARPVTRLRKTEVGKSVVAKTIFFRGPEHVQMDNVPNYIQALDEAHARGDIPELIA